MAPNSPASNSPAPNTGPDDRSSPIRARWRDDLRTLPAARRRRWLEGADRLRDGAPRARRVAEEIYRIFEAELDPDRSADRERFHHLLRHATIYDETLFGIVARFDRVAEGRDKDHARMIAARCLGTSGRLEEAVEIVEGLLDDNHLRGTPFEFEVIVSYAVLLHWQRREVELLHVIEHLRRRIAAVDPNEPLRRTHLERLSVFAHGLIESGPDRIEPIVDRLTDLAHGVSPEYGREMSAWGAAALATAAIERGDLEGARRTLVRFEELRGDAVTDTWHRRDLAPLYMRLALAEGRPGRALELADWAREKRETHRRPWNRCRIGVLALTAALAIDDPDRARAELARVEGILDSAEPARPSAGIHWRMGIDILRAIDGVETLPEEERRAIAERSTARCLHAFGRRAEEVLTAMVAFPFIFDVEESPDLRAYRTRFLEEHRALLASARSGDAPPSRIAVPRALLDADGSVQLCAWCYRARTDADRWLPVGHFLAVEPSTPATHGICDGCSSEQRESATSGARRN